LGNRLDQTLGNIALLSDPRLAELNVRFDDGLEEAVFCRERSKIFGKAGDLVSLIPWGSPVRGVHTEGLKWPLKKETLYPEKTRGISNEFLADSAIVSLESGSLLLVHRRVSQNSNI
jgi:thiamine pyrophosphokinase